LFFLELLTLTAKASIGKGNQKAGFVLEATATNTTEAQHFTTGDSSVTFIGEANCLHDFRMPSDQHDQVIHMARHTRNEYLLDLAQVVYMA